jgi:PAS domain S-box-containing protein
MLARLRVGTKLALLALLPVGVLLGFAAAKSVGDWRQAGSLREFQRATQLSSATVDVVAALANERATASLWLLRPNPQRRAAEIAAERGVDNAIRVGTRQAARWRGPVDVAGRLDAAERQLEAVRVETSSGSLSPEESADGYSSVVRGLLAVVRQLDDRTPTQRSQQAAEAYVAIVNAIEAAQRERVDVAVALTDPAHADTSRSNAARWEVLETYELDAFRDTSTGPLNANLEATLFSPAGMRVTAVREAIAAGSPPIRTSLTGWLALSADRIGGLRRLEHASHRDLDAAAADNLRAAQHRGIRDVAISVAVLMLVVALALALRRSITRPLREVSQGARTLSGGDLEFDVAYVGRDEIGDVAAAFRDLRVTAERLAGEIRAMTAAVRDNRLDHRTDVAAFEGTWAQLLADLNDTMAAFAALHAGRRRAERELTGFFDLSVDLLCIAGADGYLTRVNPAFERALGYTSEELLSQPLLAFIHPDDQERTSEAIDHLRRTGAIIDFENRYVSSDGSVRWLQWSCRRVPEEGPTYAVGRDVTESRQASNEQAALRRVATLVAEGAGPPETFTAVATELGQLVGADLTVVLRLATDDAVTIVGGWTASTLEVPIGRRFTLVGTGVGVAIARTRRAARTERFDGPPGSMPAFFRGLGMQAGVGAPITVDGRLWGVIVAVARTPAALGAGSEDRVAAFTELVVTAVANAQARVELRSHADEQAALRRVATLVARDAPVEEVFAAVVEEVGRLLRADAALLCRFDMRGLTTTAWNWSAAGAQVQKEPSAPPGPEVASLVYESAHAVRLDQGTLREADLRSAVGAPIVVADRVSGAIVAFGRAEPLPQDAEERLAAFTGLVATAIANAAMRAELRASRARIVASADETRQRIERDLHDGAQQQLVSLALKLRAAQSAVPPDLGELATDLDRVAAGLQAALDELQEYARGIHPAILAKGGLGAALRTVARRSAVPVELSMQTIGRLPESIEVAAYYVVSEALANAAKHAHASRVFVDAGVDGGVMRVRVRDDGIGGAGLGQGSGLVGLKDRVEALGGTIAVESPIGVGTTIDVSIPLVGASLPV